MQTLKELSKELNLSYSATRRRMKALGEVMENHTKRDKNSKLTVDSEGTELLRRLEDLRDQGLTIENAANKIRKETAKPSDEKRQTTDKQRQTTDKQALKEKLKGRERIIEKLEEDKQYLKDQIEKKDTQIQQLLPAAKEEEKEENEFKELGLIQVIKKWFTTKT